MSKINKSYVDTRKFCMFPELVLALQEMVDKYHLAKDSEIIKITITPIDEEKLVPPMGRIHRSWRLSVSYRFLDIEKESVVDEFPEGYVLKQKTCPTKEDKQ